MELIFLGTGAGTPSKERNVSALALTLLQEANSIWLFDCGEATQHQLLYTSLKPRKINKIFITHLHGDHVFGLPGFLSSRSFLGGTSHLTIYGPPGIKNFVQTNLEATQTHLPYPLTIEEINTQQVLENDRFTVDCVYLDHGIPSVGYRITEKDRPGELLASKLKTAGIEPGPIYQQIKEQEVVTTPDGEKLYRNDYLGPDKKGKIITILGDTRYNERHIEFVKNSDVLVHEATFNAASSDRAKDYFHSTTAQAAAIAKKANAGKLILNHISSRYQSNDYPELLDEARHIFPNTEIAYDFFQFPIPNK